MNETQDILFGVASQTLSMIAPEGRPSSITSVAVYPVTTGDSGTAETATTGSASVATNPNTTTDASAGAVATPTLIPVAATTGFAVGGRYQIVAATGESEFFTVAEIASGVSVTATAPLHNVYASSSTVHTTQISISVLDSWAADSDKISADNDPNPGYRVRWVFVVDSVTRVHDQYFDLVRYPGNHSVTPADMEDFYPQWRNTLPTYHRPDVGARLLDEAYDQVKWDLHQIGIADEQVRHQGGVDQLVKHKAVAMRLMDRALNEEVAPETADAAATAYQSRLDQLLRVVTNLPVSTDESGAAQTILPRSIWSK